MAQQEKNRENEVREEIDVDDDLDGWGPVRVRRSTIPSAPPDGLRVAGENDQAESDPQKKTLMT